MAQRFLLSAAARTLSLRSIYAEGERAAYRRFCALRWPETDGRPVCPACGCLDVYDLRTRQRFKCAACHRQFSVTSGTIFASRKHRPPARSYRPWTQWTHLGGCLIALMVSVPGTPIWLTPRRAISPQSWPALVSSSRRS